MKITTWNVNGIRSLKNSVPCILNDFASDIVCFQETKVSRCQLPENIAIIDGYTSYFSYPRKQNGYSGVATYCKDQFTPEHAQEDLSVDHQLKVEEGSLDVFDVFGDPLEMDFEGRVIVTHHYLKYKEEIRKLVIINVYCPRVDPEKPERHFYKMQFCQLLQTKMYELCHQRCFVVIVGDLNIACSLIDHCDPGNEEKFKSSEARQWLNSFLTSEIQVNGENIKAVDAFRHFYPDKKECYTCWNIKTGARLTNYGTRIDYVIVSSNLLPLLSNCEILCDYQGSDHCPVSAELKCDCVSELNVQLPSICTRLWPEFSGQQQKLQSFFQKAQTIADTVTNYKEDLKTQNLLKNKTFVKKNKQKSITSFFRNNTPVQHVSITGQDNLTLVGDKIEVNSMCSFSKESSEFHNLADLSEQQMSDCNSPVPNLPTVEEKNLTDVRCKPNEWKSLLRGPPKPPLCTKHKKPCVLRIVKKNGPNIGRQFFMCAQPAGSASNPDSNCNFFKWVTIPKVNSLKYPKQVK